MFLTKVLNWNNNFQNKLVEYLFLYHFHFSPKFSYKNITYNLTFKYIYHFYTLWQVLFWSKYIITYKTFIFYWIFLKFWVHQLPKNSNFPKGHNIFIKFVVHILSKFWNVKTFTLWEQFWGTLMCFCQVPHFIIRIKYGYRFFKNVNIGYEVRVKYSQNISQGMNQGLVFVNFTSMDLKCLHPSWYPIGVEMIFDTWPMLVMPYESWFNCEWKWIKFISIFPLVNYLVESSFLCTNVG
jgi:hypothetical protein